MTAESVVDWVKDLSFDHPPIAPPVVPAPWNGHERRSHDHLTRLSREFDALCTAAVDPAEIVAGLESAGFSDGTAAEYRCRDLFDLADRLFQATPRLVNRRPGRLANPWAERPVRHLLRGVSFAVPGLLFVACLPRVSSAMDFAALTAAMMLGWPGGQTMAFLGHSLEGRRHPLAARAVVLLGLGVSVVVAAAFGWAARELGASGAASAIGAGEIVYIASAAVILVFGSELIVLGVLTPGLVTAGLALWSDAVPSAVVAAGASFTVLCAVAAAVVISARARRRDLRVGLRVLERHDWTEAAFHAVYGIAGGALVSLPAISTYGAAVGPLSLIPVIWSMGLAEWHIVRLRRRSFELLNDSISVHIFRAQVARIAAASIARYLGDLTGLSVALGLALWLLHHAPPSTALLAGLLAGWLLGAGFYLALVLSSLGRMRVVVVAMVGSAALGATLVAFPPGLLAVIVAPGALALWLLPILHRTVVDPIRHM